jgi:hypothetical protein
MKNLGIVLVVIGLTMMLITGFNYVTKKNVINIGPVEVNKEINHPVHWSPIIGAILLVGGIVIVATTKNVK